MTIRVGVAAHRLLCPTLVAREAEQAVLAEAFAAAARGQGQTIVIGGEAGVGKSALLRTFADSARATAGRVLVGECTEIEALSPLGPFLQIIETARRSSLIRMEDAQRVGPLPQGDIDATARPRLYQGLARVFAGIARGGPLVLVIEDLHWADEATLELFRYLPRHVRAERSVLIGTYRTDELHRRHPLRPLLADLAAARLARTIDLAPLGRAATARFVRETLGLQREAPTVLSNALYERCEGNPLFVEETLEAMRARGVLRYRDGAWLGTDASGFALPDSIRDAVGRRFAMLSDEAQRMLRVAAVIGQRFDFDLLSLVAEISHDNLVDLLRAAVDAQLIVERDERGSFAFRHALTRESVLAELLEPEQRTWHRAIGLALEQRPNAADLAEELAYHFDAGGERERAFRAHVAAGKSALALAAFVRSRDHLRRAVELAGPDVDLLVLHGELAQAEGWVDPARGERAWLDVAERALAAGRPLEAGQAFAYVGAYQVSGSSPDALHNLTRAIELLEPLGASSQLAHAYDFLAQWHLFSGQPEQGMRAAQRAIEIAESLGQRGRALNVRVTQSLLGGDLKEQARVLRSAIDEIRESDRREPSPTVSGGGAGLRGATGPVSRFYNALYYAHMGVLSREREALLDEWRAWATSVHDDDAGGLLGVRAQHALGRGDFDEALRCTAEYTDESGYALAERVIEAFVRVARDGPAAGAPLIDRMRGMSLRPGAANAVNRDVAQIRLIEGDLASVLGQPGASPQYQNFRIGKAVITALYAARALGDVASTTYWYTVADELRARQDFPRFAAIYADAERAIEAGERQQALPGLVAVADALEQVDAPAIATHLRLRRADLFHADDRAGAETEFARVVAFWRGAKATWYLSELQQWAKEHGFAWPVDPTEVSGRATPTKALTERELDVARLVALGLTNKDIADRLVISERTAEGHVQRILDKLGFRSRSQIAAWHASARHEAAARSS